MADSWDAVSTAAPPAAQLDIQIRPWSARQQTVAPPVAPQADVSSGWDAVSAPVQQSQPASGAPNRSGWANTPDAFIRGAADMLTFGLADELSAAGDAAFNPVFGTGNAGETYAERYAKNLAAQRAIDQADTQQQTLPRIAGQVAGGFALPGAAADTLAGRAAVGAATGGAYGFGSGEGTQDRVINAVTGAGLGAGAGAAAPYIAQTLAFLGSKGADQLAKTYGPLRGLLNPEAEAGRRITRAAIRDIKAGDYASPADLAAAQANGQPLMVGDIGGQTMRALGRSAANTSPEARTALEAATGNRFATQGERTVSFLRSLTGATGDHAGMISDLEDAARRANAPRYRAAFQSPKAQGLWDEGFEQLSQAPVVQDAIRKANVTAANDAAKMGFTPVKNPFVMDKATGRMILRRDSDGNAALPNLQFWDAVKKNLDKVGTRDAQDFARVLRNRLDEIVPEYNAARSTAAKFFGAGDALDAGKKFVTADMGNAGARRALAKMSVAERELFRQGFASELIRRVTEASDRRSVLNQIFLGGSPAARERVEIALGRHEARQLEAFLRVENIMDMMRTAIKGNSTTARQLAELGLAGGYGLTTGDWRDAGGAYLLINGLRLGGRHIDQNVARRVGEMLASNDPRVLQRAFAGASRSREFMNGLRAAETKLTGLIGASASGTGGPAVGNVARKLLTAPPSAADEQNKP